MVDAEDLGLVEDRVELLVQLLRRLEISPERLLDHDLRVPMDVAFADARHYLRVGGGRSGAVVEAPSVRPSLPVEPLQVLAKLLHRELTFELAGDVREELRKVLPLFTGRLDLGERLDRRSCGLRELAVGHRGPGIADDGEALREKTLHEKVPEGGE